MNIDSKPYIFNYFLSKVRKCDMRETAAKSGKPWLEKIIFNLVAFCNFVAELKNIQINTLWL